MKRLRKPNQTCIPLFYTKDAALQKRLTRVLRRAVAHFLPHDPPCLTQLTGLWQFL